MVPLFWHHLLGGDVEKVGDFQGGNIRSHGIFFLASRIGGDVEKIGDFQKRKRRSHGTICWGAMLRTLTIFTGEIRSQTILFSCTTSNENLNKKVDMLHITTLFIGKSKNAWSKSSKNLLNRIDNMEQVFQGGARFCMGAMLMKMPIFKSLCGGDLEDS